MGKAPLSPRELEELLQLLDKTTWWGGDAPGSAKWRFKTLARRLLRRLAEDLDLPKGSYDLRWNRAGPASSGEATLHAERLYVTIAQTGGLGILYRSCQGRRDYRGGANQWLPYENLADWDACVMRIARHLHLTQGAAKKSSGRSAERPERAAPPS